MRIEISSDAERDIESGYWFYESQSIGIGDYFRSSILADVDSLVIHGGSHAIVDGYHRKVCTTFPFKIYYEMTSPKSLIVIAVVGQRENRKPK